jgi:exopolysaccharide biosynthesis polyprenyl glycosylphosphotransferase
MLRRNTNYIIFSFIFDWLLVIASVFIASWLRFNIPIGKPIQEEEGIITLLVISSILYPLVYLLFSIYDPERTYHAVDEYQILSIASFIAGLTLAGLIYFTARDISRLTMLYFFGIEFILVVTWRGWARILRRGLDGNGRSNRQVLLIGGGDVAKRALERLNELSWAGISLVGYLTDGELIPETNDDLLYMGKLDKVNSVVTEQHVDDVLVALPAESYIQVNQLVSSLIDKPCNIWVVPDYFSLLLYGGYVEDLGGVPMISLKSPTLTGYQRVIKRAFDLIVGTLLQIVILPLMGIISLAIKLDSPGPVFFKQKRVGENGRMFWMYKFRSMVQDADTRLKEVIRFDERGNIIHKSPEDPRVTKVGKIIRKTSLDELPNFFNVLLGDMSIVGPRPEMPIFVEKYEAWQRARFAVPQGITGWWQVSGRSDKPMHLNTEDDLYYVRNYSLFLDLQIIFKTVLVVLRGKGAY